MKEAATKIAEEETTTTQPGNNTHVGGRPRQPKESGGNSKGTLRYEAETRTWKCAKCDKKYAEKDARGAASHVATRTRTNQKIGKQEQQITRPNAYQNSDETRLRTLARYGAERRGASEKDAPEEFADAQEQKNPQNRMKKNKTNLIKTEEQR